MFRCINNPFGYCYQKPNVPDDTQVYHYPGPDGKSVSDLYHAGTCVNNWQTCSFYLSWSKECERYGVPVQEV